MISILCCTCPQPNNDWLKLAMPIIASIFSFLLALFILPLIRARNEKKRLESLKTVVILWLEFFNSKISMQMETLTEFINAIEHDTNPIEFPFRVVDFQIDHFLNYNDDDLRKVLFEKIDRNPNPQLYIEIVNDLRFIKTNQKHLEDTYDKWEASPSDNHYLEIFQISLQELTHAHVSFTNFIAESRGAKIKSDWWIWS